MHSSNSYILTVTERIRALLDDPDVDAKYSNDWICRHIIGPAQKDVLARIAKTSSSPVVLKATIAVVQGQEYYTLPPCVQEVVRLAVVDQNRTVIIDVQPRDRMSYRGPVWALEGSPGALELFIPPTTVLANGEVQFWYITNGDIFPHYGTGTLALDSDSALTLCTLGNTPTFGVLDRRPNAYCGMTLRLLPSGTDPIEERLITSHTFTSGSPDVWQVGTRRPFTYASAGSVTYEISPPGMQDLYECISCWGAMKLATARKVSEAHYNRLRTDYLAALKTSIDQLSEIQGRIGKSYTKDTSDNPLVSIWGWHPTRG